MRDPISIGAFRDKQAQRIEALEKALSELESLVSRSQEIIGSHLDPANSVTSEEAISRLVGLLDGPEQRRIQGDVWNLLGTKGALTRSNYSLPQSAAPSA